MIDALSPFLAAAALLGMSTLVGRIAVVKLIRVYEARHELKQGSAGAIRMISGWSFVAFWLMSVWFLATICGDWHSSGDLEGALDRSLLRLRVLLEIAAAIASSD